MKHQRPILETNLPETTRRKRPTPAAARKEAKPSQPPQPTPNRIRTILVASHGWPTDAVQPSKKRSIKR